jgi:ATP-binding cassette subfamily C protein LapB
MLLAKPSIMLLDEPTASMDGSLEARVMNHLFNEVSATSSLVVVTHKTGLLALVNRIIVVEKGRILLDGPKDAVLAKLQELNGLARKAQQPAANQPVGSVA